MTRIAGMATGWYRNLLEIEWLWEPRYLWIGYCWKRYPKAVEIYLCILPCLPIRIYWQWEM